jgi:hypothetical protein
VSAISDAITGANEHVDWYELSVGNSSDYDFTDVVYGSHFSLL